MLRRTTRCGRHWQTSLQKSLWEFQGSSAEGQWLQACVLQSRYRCSAFILAPSRKINSTNKQLQTMPIEWCDMSLINFDQQTITVDCFNSSNLCQDIPCRRRGKAPQIFVQKTLCRLAFLWARNWEDQLKWDRGSYMSYRCHTYVIHVHTRVMHFGQMILTWVYINTYIYIYMRLQVTTWRPSLKKSNLVHSAIDPIITLKAHQSQQKSRKSSSQEVLQSAICRIFPQSVGAQVELSARSSGWLATGLRWHQMFGNLPKRKVVKRHWVSLTWVIEIVK